MRSAGGAPSRTRTRTAKTSSFTDGRRVAAGRERRARALGADALQVAYTKAELDAVRAQRADETDAPAVADAPEPPAQGLTARPALLRLEEELEIGSRIRELGSLRAHKRVEVHRVAKSVRRDVEHFEDVDRRPANSDDSGEIEFLPDGSISIPLFEEELVVTKQPVIRERVVIRTDAEVDSYRLEARLRRERVELESDDDLDAPRP